MITFADRNIIHVNFTVNRHGAAVGDLIYFGDDAPAVGTKEELTIDEVSWVVTVVASTDIGPGKTKLRIVSGAGDMSNTTVAKNLNNTNGNRIIKELLANTEEELGEMSDNVANFELKQWEILESVPIGLQISRYLDRFDKLVWRHNREGQIVVVDDSNSVEADMPTDITLDDALFDGSLIYQVHELDKMPEVGAKHEEFRIEQIGIVADEVKTRLTLYKQSLSDAFDLIASQLHRSSLQRVYPARVEKQNSDGPNGRVGGTLQVIPDDPRIQGGGMDKLPIRSLPGWFLSVPVNTRCFIQFDADDPSRPFVAGFEQHPEPSDFDGVASGKFVAVAGNPSNAQFVALSNLVDDRIQNIVDFLNNSLVLSTPVGPTSPGAVSPIASQDSTAGKRLKSE